MTTKIIKITRYLYHVEGLCPSRGWIRISQTPIPHKRAKELAQEALTWL